MPLLLFSCTEKRKKLIQQAVRNNDTTCLQEIEKAKADISHEKIVYCHYTGNILFQQLRAKKEMDSLLGLYKIDYENESSPCVIEDDKNYHCYCEYMQAEIDSKYGAHFTDLLLYTADSLFISKNLDKFYDNSSKESTWDAPPIFPGDSSKGQSYHSGLQDEFNKLITYPQGYKFKNGEHSGAMLQIHLDIDQLGNATITNRYNMFWNYVTKEEDYNKEFYDYFGHIADSLIENTRWVPAKIKSLSVKSKNQIFIYLK